MYQLRYILSLGSYGFSIVITSMLCLYLGIWIDGVLKMEPTFTIGLLFLGIVLCVGRLYKEAWNNRNK